MTDRVGEELGKYRLVRLLGRGSFAEVYLGEHVYLKAEAAVKVLRTQLADSDVESFLKEAQIIARLVHPHIIRIFDFDVQEGTPFLVMDYAPQGTLRQRHPKGKPVPLRTVVHYVRQVADALQYAHNQKFIHRDVKPENMLLGRRDEVLLSDFGIVQVVISTLSENEGTQKIEGTIAYMAPEQLRGKARYATDQYALGVVVYEWLSGNRPFQGSLSEMVSQHMFVPPPPLREKVTTIPPAVEEVVMMALAKDPKERFANVQAFATAIEQATSVTPTLPYSGTSPYAPPTPIVFTAPPAAAGVNETQQVQPQIQPPRPTVIASPGIRPLLGQQPPPAMPTTSTSSGAPVFTDPPAQIQQQPPAVSDPSLPAVAPVVYVQPSQTQQHPSVGTQVVHTAYQPIGTDPGRLQKQHRRKTGRNLLLIALTILIIAGTLTAVILLRKPLAGLHPGMGIGVSKAPDGEYIGLSDGTFAFDTNRPDGPLKQQAVAKLKAGDRAGATRLLQQAIAQDTNDAEALIYLEDLRVLASHAHYITLVVGTMLTAEFIGFGREDLQGAYVAQKEYNSGLKLPGGTQVRLLIANTGSIETRDTNTAVAQQIVQAAQTDKTLVGVMGWPFSEDSKDVIGVLGVAHIPMISATAYFDFLTGISPYFFRVIVSNRRQVAAGIQYVEQKLHAKRAALFADPTDLYSKELAVDFEQQFIADGNNIVASENYTVGHPLMLPGLLQDALKYNPDVIFFAGYAEDIGILLTNLPTSGPFAHLQVLGADLLDESYPGKASAEFNRLHFTSYFDVGTWNFLHQAAKKPIFFTDYPQDFDPQKQHTGDPYGYTLAEVNSSLSYDAMLALLTGCNIALSGGKKTFSPSELRQALTKITGSQAIQGVTGQISFGPDGNAVNKAVILLKLDPNGNPVIDSVQGSFLLGS